MYIFSAASLKNMSEPLHLFLLKNIFLQNKCSPILNRRAFLLFNFLRFDEHIFYKNPVTTCRIVNEYMSNCTNKFAVLDYRRTRHKENRRGTTKNMLTFVFGNRRQGNSGPKHSLLRCLPQTKSHLQFHHRWRRGPQTKNLSWRRFRRELRFRAKRNLR